MDISVVIFFFILFIYVVSLVTALAKKKFNGLFKKIFRTINRTALGLTIILIILWFFDIHLSNLNIEIVPFWTFLISSIILYGLTKMTQGEKIFHGLFFFGHLFVIIILVIPFVGLGIASTIYSPFLIDYVLYEDDRLIVTDEMGGFLSMKPSPTIYLKNGLLSHKYKTEASPIYEIDSLSLVSYKDKIHLMIYDDTTRTKIYIDR